MKKVLKVVFFILILSNLSFLSCMQIRFPDAQELNVRLNKIDQNEFPGLLDLCKQVRVFIGGIRITGLHNVLEYTLVRYNGHLWDLDDLFDKIYDNIIIFFENEEHEFVLESDKEHIREVKNAFIQNANLFIFEILRVVFADDFAQWEPLIVAYMNND